MNPRIFKSTALRVHQIIITMLCYTLATIFVLTFPEFLSSFQLNLKRITRSRLHAAPERRGVMLDWLSQLQLPLKTGGEKLKPAKRLSESLFGRTNRVDGQEKWMKELYHVWKTIKTIKTIPSHGLVHDSNDAVIVELAKELLYSGIPEQVLELYATYYDVLITSTTDDEVQVIDYKFSSDKHMKLLYPTKTSSDIFFLRQSQTKSVRNSEMIPVVPNPKMVMVATRAFITLADVVGAIRLLQACSRAGMNTCILSLGMVLLGDRS